MRFFDIDFDKLGIKLLPTKLRNWKIIAMTIAFVAGIKSIYGKFWTNRKKNLDEVTRFGTVRHLEAILNDAFDIAFRRITVVDALTQFEPVYIFQDPEQKPVYIFQDPEQKPITLFTDYEVEFLGMDFIVKIPYTIPYDLARMNALVKGYKMPGVAYEIQEIL